jgi:lactobin A/cerein 7B family class IIb bacteriocin
MKTQTETFETAPLSDAELAEVNGGLIFLAFAVGAAAGFGVGVLVKERASTISMGELGRLYGF